LLQHTGRNNDDKEKNYDANNQADAHLHVLPPHLLSHSVGAASEALSRDGEVVCLILQRVESLASLGDLVDILSHNADGIVDLLFPRVSLNFSLNTLPL
jgi:hypothetical protein